MRAAARIPSGSGASSVIDRLKALGDLEDFVSQVAAFVTRG